MAANAERHVVVLRHGSLSETDYYRLRFADKPGVWVRDMSDDGKEKFFVSERMLSIRFPSVDDLL